MSKQQTESKATGSEYQFSGSITYGLQTRIPVQVTEARVQTDERGKQYVVAQVLMGMASTPVPVTFTIEQALEADIIMKAR